MRLFIAISVPGPLAALIGKTTEPLKYWGLDAAWVRPENLHLTVKFLGETQSALLASIKETVARVAARHSAFNARLTAFDFFPNDRRPRILYAGIDNEIKLGAIARDIEEHFQTLGFTAENRFRAHLTIARFKSTANLRRSVEKIKSVEISGTIAVNALALVQSTLATAGAVYQTLFTAPLAGSLGKGE